MLKKLKRTIKEVGITRVTSDLGYRSLNTINLWIKNDKIPTTAKERVKNYLDKVSK
jgi:hypothetical protein